MWIGSFGHEYLDLRLKNTDVYFDIRDDFPKINIKCRFGIDKKIQKHYLSQEGVKDLYKKNIYAKVMKKIDQRKHHSFRVFIGDQYGAKESVILVEKLEKDLLKKHKIQSTIDHVTLTVSV